MSLWLALLALAFPISIAASSITLFPLAGLYILAGYWTFRWFPPRWGSVEKAFAIFWGVSVLAAFYGLDPEHSLSRLAKKDLYVFIILLVGALTRKDPALRLKLLKIFVAGGVLSAVVGLIQRASGLNQTDLTEGMRGIFLHTPPFFEGWPRWLLDPFAMINGRAVGLRHHALRFAETLLFPLAYMLTLLATRHPLRWPRWAAVTAVLLGGLLVSQSRGPWLAFAAMAAALVLIEPRKRLLIALGAVIAIPVLLIMASPKLRHRALSIGDASFLSNSERLMMWRAGAHMLRDHPLLGIGPGNVKRASPQYQTPQQNESFGAWGHLHNTYVNIAVERGLLGLCTFLFFIGVLGGTLWRAYRRAPRDASESSRRRRTILLTALLSGVGWLASGLTEAVYNDSSIQMMFYFVMSLALVEATEEPEASAAGGRSRV